MSTFNSGVNPLWSSAAGQIETLNNFPPFQKVEPCGTDGDTVCGINLASCEQLTFNAQLKQLTDRMKALLPWDDAEDVAFE